MKYLILILLTGCTETIIQSEYWDNVLEIDLRSGCASHDKQYHKVSRPSEYDSKIYHEQNGKYQFFEGGFVLDSGFVIHCEYKDLNANQIIKWK